MNVYIETSFKQAIAPIEADLLTSLLADIGYESFTEEQGVFSAYITEELFDPSKLNEVLSTFPDLSPPEFIKHQPQNWNALWESQFEPIRINDNCWIRAPFHDEISNVSIQLIIEPKMSFGTGHHATTRLMCSLMTEMNFVGKQVWDYGCGTGVLGILAAKLGAVEVNASDIESWALENAIENAGRNNVQLNVFNGEPATGKFFDVILANINRNVLTDTAAMYLPRLKENGKLLISGFLMQDESFLIDFFEKKGLNKLKTLHENGWCCILFEKSVQ